jgi:hypothetical protein
MNLLTREVTRGGKKIELLDLPERKNPRGVLAHSVIDGLNAGVRIARDQRRCGPDEPPPRTCRQMPG